MFSFPLGRSRSGSQAGRGLVGLGLSQSLNEYGKTCEQEPGQKENTVIGKNVLKSEKGKWDFISVVTSHKEQEMKCLQIFKIPLWIVPWALKLKDVFFNCFNSYIWILNIQICVLYSYRKKGNWIDCFPFLFLVVPIVGREFHCSGDLSQIPECQLGLWGGKSQLWYNCPYPKSDVLR